MIQLSNDLQTQPIYFNLVFTISLYFLLMAWAWAWVKGAFKGAWFLKSSRFGNNLTTKISLNLNYQNFKFQIFKFLGHLYDPNNQPFLPFESLFEWWGDFIRLSLGWKGLSNSLNSQKEVITYYFLFYFLFYFLSYLLFWYCKIGRRKGVLAFKDITSLIALNNNLIIIIKNSRVY